MTIKLLKTCLSFFLFYSNVLFSPFFGWTKKNKRETEQVMLQWWECIHGTCEDLRVILFNYDKEQKRRI